MNKGQNEKGLRQRLFQWQALPSPKMQWPTFKRMITMERFKEFTGAERPNEVLREWRESQLITTNKSVYYRGERLERG
jgi:hypothetical protein